MKQYIDYTQFQNKTETYLNIARYSIKKILSMCEYLSVCEIEYIRGVINGYCPYGSLYVTDLHDSLPVSDAKSFNVIWNYMHDLESPETLLEYFMGTTLNSVWSVYPTILIDAFEHYNMELIFQRNDEWQL